MGNRRRSAASAVAAALVLLPPAAWAGVMADDPPASALRPPPAVRSLVLPLGFAELFRFGEPVDTVVIGDTAVLGASVLDSRRIVLTALAQGRTNVIVVGEGGAPIARMVVRVAAREADPVVLYNGTRRTLLLCDPDCLPIADAAAARVRRRAAGAQ